MPLSRSQFTIGQWVYLTYMCAFVFLTLRGSGPAYLVYFLPIILPFPIDRAKRSQGLSGSVPFRCLVSVGCVIAYCTYFYLNPDPDAVNSGVLMLLIVLPLLLASLWRVTLDKPGISTSLTDESCGPIVWRGLGDEVKP